MITWTNLQPDLSANGILFLVVTFITESFKLNHETLGPKVVIQVSENILLMVYLYAYEDQTKYGSSVPIDRGQVTLFFELVTNEIRESP